MPNGTLIQTYTDVTERKQAAAELDARNSLQGLVRERTAELVDVNARLQKRSSSWTARSGARSRRSGKDDVSELRQSRHPQPAQRHPRLCGPGAVERQGKPAGETVSEPAEAGCKGRELGEMVSDFLDYSRADRVTTAPFALAPLIRSAS